MRTVAESRRSLKSTLLAKRTRTLRTWLLRDREIIIDRTCARCRCEYEWGVHVAFYAERAGLSSEQVTSLTHGAPSDPCWANERDRLLIEAAGALHDTADIDDALWRRMAELFSDEQLLDLLMLCGWYPPNSFTANGARIACEDGAPRFADVLRRPRTGSWPPSRRTARATGT